MDKDVIGWLIIGGIVAGFLSLGLWVICTSPPSPGEDNCPTSEGVRYPVTSIVVDVTDPMSDTQADYVREFVKERLEELSKWERVRMFAVSEEEFAPTPLFDRCNPGSPKEASEVTSNPRMIRETFESTFEAPFWDVFEETVTGESLGKSPIMETIRAASSYFHRDERGMGHRMLVISDLLQHGEEYSQYGGTLEYDHFEELAFAREVGAALTGSEIEVIYLRRKERGQEFVQRHIDFWYDYFQAQGGRVIQVTKVR